jgi:hypothetical protein
LELTFSPMSHETRTADPSETDDGIHGVLEARLMAESRVLDFHRSDRAEIALMSSEAPPGSAVRIARTLDRTFTIVAIPAGSGPFPLLRRSLCRHWKHRHVLVLSERWLRRRPYLDGSNLIADSARYPVSPLARVLIAEHLTDYGGSSTLSDCAGQLPRTRDPVRAILSLAAAKAVAIDISRPIGPWTRVFLPPSR